MRILLVDDSADTLATTARLLDYAGHETRTALNGKEALRLAEEFQPDAVLVDLGLPVMDGYEVSLRLREVLSGLRIVALSGFKSDPDRERAAGIDCHLLKPASLNDMLEAIGAGPLKTSPAAAQHCPDADASKTRMAG
jgi:CheY-like chemotaxis protein